MNVCSIFFQMWLREKKIHILPFSSKIGFADKRKYIIASFNHKYGIIFFPKILWIQLIFVFLIISIGYFGSLVFGNPRGGKLYYVNKEAKT